MPNPANPQSWNGYAYVNNRPINFNDPTGHLMEGSCSLIDDDCDPPHPLSGNPVPVGNDGRGNGSGNKSSDKVDKGNRNEKGDLIYCAEDFLTCSASFTQDVATTITTLSAGAMIAFIVGGCFAGPEGCGAGALAGLEAYNLGPNQLETGLGFLSLILTAASDLQNYGELGDATETSYNTFLAGGAMIDPISDALIDIYASGYNHGYFNSTRDIMNGESILNKPFIWK